MASMDPGARRRLVAGSTLGVGVALLAALLGFVNYFGWKYHTRFDWTSSRLYTLSEKSISVVKGLDRDVEAVVFLRPGSPMYDPTREILSRYASASTRVKVRYVDPDRNPVETQQLIDRYGVGAGGEGGALDVVVLDSGSDKRIVSETDLAEYDYSGMQFGAGPELKAYKGEQAITAALLELQETGKKKILFTTGHGEASLDDSGSGGLSGAREILARDNFDIEEWASLGQPAVPEGTALVVVAGPTASFVQPEVDAFDRFLAGGGRLLVLLDPTLEGTSGALHPTGLEAWLAGLGVEVGQDIVVDPSNPLPFFGPETIFVNSFGDHAVTKTLMQANVPVILSLARSVRAASTPPAGMKAVELVRTSDAGWGETGLANLGAVEKDDKDVAGPVALAVAIAPESKDDAAKPDLDEEALAEEPPRPEAAADKPALPASRLVVVGDSDFATNTQLQNVGNPTFFSNLANWLVERESLLAIPPKAPEQVRLTLTSGQLASVYWLVLAILPGLAITVGIVVAMRRRR